MKLKKMLAAITAVSLAVSTILAAGFTANAEDNDGITVSAEYSLDTEAYLPDSAELEAMYINQLFYGDSGISLFADYGSRHLTGNQLVIYNFLKPKIEAVANGTITNTSFVYTPASVIDQVTLRTDISAAVQCLMVDLPQYFYWFDKVTGYQNSYSGYDNNNDKIIENVTDCTISFSVSQNYGSGTTTNISRINSAKNAVANARAIAAKYNGKNDYEKIIGYKDEICALTSYNGPAASNSSTPYGDPWQLVYVFDNDSSTNVVCEGYAKAFQYLCDLGGVDCYTVTGDMDGGTGAGPHMWNIVSLGGKSYLVDVTNCDAGTIGSPDKLCLKGASASNASGCTVNDVRFVYDSETLAMYPASILTVSTTDYDPGNAGTSPDTPPEEVFYQFRVEGGDVELTVGESVTKIAAVLYYDAEAGANKNMTSGGVASDYFEWSIENSSVATIDQAGTVTAVAPGTTRGNVKFKNNIFPNGYVETTFGVTVKASSSDIEEPSDPSNPSRPSTPSNPSVPSGPSDDITTPTRPGNPSRPSTPSNPSDPSGPSDDITTPTRPGNPSRPSTPSNPSDPSGPSDDISIPARPVGPSDSSSVSSSSSTSSTAPASSTTIVDAILATPDGGNGSVTLGSSAKLDKTAMETLATKGDVTVRFNVSGGAYWEINGANVTDAKAVDLGVRVNGNLIPESKVDEFAGDKTTIQLSLKHNGDFGFTGTLNVPVGKANDGKFANLYYYHGGQFDFVGSSAISDGRAKFAFSHASNYLIVIDDYAYGEDVSSAAGMTETTEASAVPYVAALVVVSAFGASAIVLKKRLSK